MASLALVTPFSRNMQSGWHMLQLVVIILDQTGQTVPTFVIFYMLPTRDMSPIPAYVAIFNLNFVSGTSDAHAQQCCRQVIKRSKL